MPLAIMLFLSPIFSAILTEEWNGSAQARYKRTLEDNTSTTLPESDEMDEFTWNFEDWTTPDNSVYQFIVHIMYAGKIFALGIMFQPRFVLAPHTKLFFYDEFDIYVVYWSNIHFQDKSLIKRIIKVQTYRKPDWKCDFDLSILQIESAFEGTDNFWNVSFMDGEKPSAGTICVIVHFSLNYLHELNATVIDWERGACYNERGYMYKCENESFLCLLVDKPTEVDISGSPVMCNGTVVGSIAGYYIHELIIVQYLPYYKDWFYKNSNSLKSGCNYGGADEYISLMIALVLRTFFHIQLNIINIVLIV